MVKRKVKQIPEQKISGPIRISKEALIASMRRLVRNEDFILLKSLWLDKRGKILEDGKGKPSEGQWYVLKGFDLSILEPEKWAAMDSVADDHKRRAAELQERLAGTTEER